MYEIIRGRLKSLFVHEQLFIELFTRTQTGEFYINVLIWRIARKSDNILREIDYLHRLAHIEHEYLAALCGSTRLKNKGHSLGDGHEITDDILVSDGYRTAVCYLILEKRNNGTVRAEDIAESDRDELGIRMLVVGLDYHLADTLCRAHDIRGVDSLIC